MFLRATVRKKDGKEHTYYSVVENKRLADGRVIQRHVLYLGEINSSQQLAWRKSIEVFDEEHPQSARTIALFPEDRCEAVVGEEDVVRLRLSQLRLERPRQWGGCWPALRLYRELGLDAFWAERLPPSRKGTRWDLVLLILVVYRLFTIQAWHYLVRQAGERAGLGHVHPHMLRLSCGHVLADQGVDIRLLQDWLGHRDIRHTGDGRAWPRGVPKNPH